jgi:predicted nuclease with TOPRIM domain
MQKLLQAAANISRASTAAALQSTLPQQSFRVAAVFAKLWMQVSDALAAADSQPDVIKKMASLQRLVGRMAVAHKQQQDALQQESSAKTGPDQDTVMADMREKSQQQLLQLRHELATSRRDLQDVLQELHRAKQELCEKQAARSNPQDSSESGQAAYDVLHNRIASQQAALSTLQEKMHAKQTEYKSLEEKLALEVRAYEQLKSNRLQGEAALKLLQVQCKQQQDELLAYNTGRTQLELERTKFHSERDAWEAQQAERVAGNVRLQEQKAACRARLQEQQAEQKRFQERHLAIKRNLSTADYSKQRQLAAEQAQLEADQAQLAAGRAKLQEERVQFSKQIAAERFSMREAVKAARGERSLQIWRWCAIMLAWLVLFAICWLR